LTSQGPGALPLYAPAGAGGGGGAWFAPLLPPEAAAFPNTALNLGGSLVNQLNGCVLTAIPGASGSDAVQWATQAVPALGATGWQVIAAVTPLQVMGGTAFAGIVVKQAASTKLRIFGQDNLRPLNALLNYSDWNKYANENDFRSVIAPIFWQRVQFDGTNLIWSQSLDGLYWTEMLTETAASSYVGVPDQVGFCANFASNNLSATQAAQLNGVLCASWKASSY
jgi:hypothetical protein